MLSSVRYKRRKKAQQTETPNIHLECLHQRPTASEAVTGAGDTSMGKAPIWGRGDARQSSLWEHSKERLRAQPVWQTGKARQGTGVRAESAEGVIRPTGAAAGPRRAPRGQWQRLGEGGAHKAGPWRWER